MTATRLACPHCRTPLRVRDPARLPGTVDCPECGSELAYDRTAASFRLATDAADETSPESLHPEDVDVSGILATAPSAGAGSVREDRIRRAIEELDATPREPDEPTPLERRAPSRLEQLRSPAGIAWVVAAVGAIGLALVMLPDGTNNGTQQDPTESDPIVDDAPPDPALAVSTEPEPLDELRERLAGLGERLGRFQAREGGFPAGASAERLQPDERLSWLARLEEADNLGGSRAPDWDRPFHDPANAEFVQRSRPAFLNPALETTTARDGRPATHFVGVGGVGPDGPELPVTNSRAGVFGLGRAARAADITDGLSNTMLVAGVRSNLGSWAASGSATIRPFTAEPYVNGPDGFATGSTDSMLVLMADGRVRTIAADADPRLVRRMAAIADGLDLELVEPGEPGDRETVEPEPMPVAVDDDGHPVDLPDSQPPELAAIPMPDIPEVALPELPKWTPDLVARKLAQPIKGLKTRQPVEAGLLLEEVADLVGVPIHLKEEDGIDQGFLDNPITLSVGEGTVGDILDALLAKLELRYVVEDDGLRLLERKPGE